MMFHDSLNRCKRSVNLTEGLLLSFKFWLEVKLMNLKMEMIVFQFCKNQDETVVYQTAQVIVTNKIGV